MRKIRIKHISIQNFCKFFGANVVDTDIYDATEICGVNESGKSTIKRAIQHILNCRDDNGKEITGIRPHDDSGKDYTGIETVNAVMFDVDGETKELKKIFRENVNKNGEVIGNLTDCYINDIPKKSKDYAEYLDTEFLPEDKLQYCLNAQALLKKGASDQREILEKTFGCKSVEDIASEDAEFFSIVPMLKDGTIKELKERCNRALNGSRGRTASKGLRQIADEYAPRIDELSKQLINVDVAELENRKSDISAKIEDVKVKIKDSSAEHEALGQEILQIKFDISGLQNKANESLNKTRNEIIEKLNIVNRELTLNKNALSDFMRKKENLEIELKRHTNLRESYAEKWKLVSAKTIGEYDTICPTCGRELENADEIKANYESNKKEILATVEKNGLSEKSEIERCSTEINEICEKLSEQQKKVDTLQKDYNDLDSRLATMPSHVDITNTSEYQKMIEKLREKESVYSNQENALNVTNSHKKELEVLESNLLEVMHDIGKASINDDIKNQISNLRAEQRKTQQDIASQERLLELLKQLDRKKNEILSESVNKYLEFCEVKMFRPLINGDTEECCEFIYKGEPYNRNMNHGAKLLTEIDICRAFQKKNDVEMPIIIDDTESLDSWRVPKIDSQLIVIRRTDDKELIIKNMEE